jgi:hypothetical protein
MLRNVDSVIRDESELLLIRKEYPVLESECN